MAGNFQVEVSRGRLQDTMTKAEDKKLLAKARKAGQDYAMSQIEGDYFSDYVAQQVHEAEKDPEHHWSVTNKTEAMRAAARGPGSRYLARSRHEPCAQECRRFVIFLWQRSFRSRLEGCLLGRPSRSARA